jgi:hypothetical protein
MHSIAKLILDCYFLPIYSLYYEIRCLWEPLTYLKLAAIPKWLLGFTWFISVYCCTNNKWGSFNEILIYFKSSFRLNSFRKICYIYLWLLWQNEFVCILHNINHEIAILVYFYDCKIYFSSCKVTHLVSNIETIGRAGRIFVTNSVTWNVYAVSWRVTY